MTDWLGDTNLWLRSSEPAHPMFGPATAAVRRVVGLGDALHLVPQVVTEFWRVATSAASQRGGFGWDPARADAEVRALETLYPITPDTPAVFDWWRTLVVSADVRGRASTMPAWPPRCSPTAGHTS